MTVVFTNGVFDILHGGHYQLLRYGSQLGTKLIVGLNSDRSCNILHKAGIKSYRNMFKEQQRRSIILSTKLVDQVFLFDESTPYNLIKKLKPDILLKGGDYEQTKVVGRELVDKIIIMPISVQISSTSIKKRLLKLFIQQVNNVKI